MIYFCQKMSGTTKIISIYTFMTPYYKSTLSKSMLFPKVESDKTMIILFSLPDRLLLSPQFPASTKKGYFYIARSKTLTKLKHMPRPQIKERSLAVDC